MHATVKSMGLLSLVLLIASSPACAELTVAETADQGFIADYYTPADAESNLGVVVLGGSEGGKPTNRAKYVAELGYPTLGVAYFKEDGLPDYLDEVPIEPIQKAIDWLAGRPETSGNGVVLVGGSKGAELALLIAAENDNVTGVVAYAPSHVVFQGIPRVFWPPRSSWKQGGKPVPYVPYQLPPRFNYQRPDLLELYQESLKDKQAVERAAVAVERINGPVLLFSGGADRIWPSAEMAEAVIARLEEHKFAYDYEHVTYAEAGHAFAPLPDKTRQRLGGTTKANVAAMHDSFRRQKAFLERIASSLPEKE